MNNDPVISSKYGVRPLLDLPALDVHSGSGTWNPTHLPTMVPPHFNRVPQQPQPQPQPETMMVQVPMPRPALPMDWPFAVGLPGSLFAAPPGPTVIKPAQMFPYNFLHQAPFTMQPPPFQFTDNNGQPVEALTQSPEHQQLSLMYPGVHDPCPPQRFNAMIDGLLPPGLIAHRPQRPEPAEPEVATFDRVHFEGVLTYGRPSTDHHTPDMTRAFSTLPQFLRLELENTYGHEPATDVRIVLRHGEFHVYASPRQTGGDLTDRSPREPREPGEPHPANLRLAC